MPDSGSTQDLRVGAVDLPLNFQHEIVQSAAKPVSQ
jgi:hypothetical protein